MRFNAIFASTIFVVGALSVGSLTVRNLPTDERTGDFPVCFNGTGELLPCADGVDPPPASDRYTGFWSGIMVYERAYTGDDVCYDADVTLRIEEWSSGTVYIESIIVERDTGGQQIDRILDDLAPDGYVSGSFSVFDTRTEYSLLFDTQGHADGVWTNTFDECYGTWSFSKD